MSRRFTAVAIALVAAVIALGGCGSTDSGGAKAGAGGAGGAAGGGAGAGGGLTATADLYSGKPNPQWTISSDTAGSLTKAVDALSESTESAPAEGSGLGFRGVDVSNLPTRHGAASTARVAAHEVTLEVGGTTVRLADPQSSALMVIIGASGAAAGSGASGGAVDTAVLDALQQAIKQ